MDEWILHTMNINTFDCNTESWVGEAISKEMRRHQNAKCFNCSRIGHLRGFINKKFLGIISPLRMKTTGELRIQVYVEGVAKDDIGPMNADQQKTDKAT